MQTGDVMEEPRYKELILDTIDQLRKRKARPDLERICHMLERKHGLSSDTVKADLQRLVASDVVAKVEYKGSISYRNVAKLRKFSKCGQYSQTAAYISQKLLTGIRDIFQSRKTAGGDAKDSDEQDERIVNSVSVQDIDQWLETEVEDLSLSHSQIETALERDVQAGRLKKLANDEYIIEGNADDIVDAAQKRLEREREAAKARLKHTKKKSLSPGNNPGGSPRKGPGRPPGPSKRKRVKKDHGPDFESYDIIKASRVPRRDSQDSDKTEPSEDMSDATSPSTIIEDNVVEDVELVCDFCQQTSARNRIGKPENLLVCKDCQAKAHPSCMDYSDELAKRARNSPWQCIDCKVCWICSDSGDADAMLFCDACDKGYHMDCHIPPVTGKLSGKWVCSQCVDDMESKDGQSSAPSASPMKQEAVSSSDGGGASCLPTPSASPVQFHDRENGHSRISPKMNGHLVAPVPVKNEHNSRRGLSRLAEHIRRPVPDASHWSISEVEQYFKDVGFPDQAPVFKEQEIDGASLLLMKRTDVLTGLSIKLGPALKIYHHVQRLQTRGQIS